MIACILSLLYLGSKINGGKMAVYKLFECMLFNPNTDCPYTVSGEEEYVIDQAASHELVEHGIEDTPETREKIKKSLIDTGSPNK
jgi:hypothetical protein